MKDRKKRVGVKAQIRATKERERWIITVIFLVFVLLIVIISGYFTYTLLNQSENQTVDPASSQRKAVIVDHLSLTFPNQTFIETATKILEQSGYKVDHYPGEKVTVELYRDLPTRDYEIVILRVHSSAAVIEGEGFAEIPVSLFTSENYTKNKYVWEQLDNQLLIASYTMPYPPYYFAITPRFVTSSMKGEFKNAIVIMMGCEGLNNTGMAKALTQKGAEAYISWKGSVSASHTDKTTIHLLKHLLQEKQTIKQAVDTTMKEVGPDPASNSQLAYYPLETGDQTIEDIKSNP